MIRERAYDANSPKFNFGRIDKTFVVTMNPSFVKRLRQFVYENSEPNSPMNDLVADLATTTLGTKNINSGVLVRYDNTHVLIFGVDTAEQLELALDDYEATCEDNRTKIDPALFSLHTQLSDQLRYLSRVA